MKKYAIVVERAKRNYAAYVPDLPGCVATGATVEEAEQLLREAVWRLPQRCQRLVQMLFFESPPRPYSEIARDLKLAEGSIGFIRQRCLDKLRREFERVSSGRR